MELKSALGLAQRLAQASARGWTLELERGDTLLQAHLRVRDAARRRGVQHRVEPHLPPDVLGVYVDLPTTGTDGQG
jgi:hypothetical protein